MTDARGEGVTQGALRYECAGATHTGWVRDENEDDFVAFALSDAAEEHGYVAAVADGVGGHAAGARASQLAIASLGSAYYEARAASDVRVSLAEAYSRANSEILRYASEHPETRGMGSTLVAAAFHECDLTVANLGDSRCYILRDGVLRGMTLDHTVAQSQADAFSQHVPAETPGSNQLTRCLGVFQDDALPDVREETLQPGDMVLLCSDGLTGLVSEPELCDIMQAPQPVRDLAYALVDAALDKGGTDNVTAVVVAVSSLTP